MKTPIMIKVAARLRGKEAGLKSTFTNAITRPNPLGAMSEKERARFVNLGKKVDNGIKLTAAESKRFNELAHKSPPRVLRIPSLFKKQ
jgi:hypothetical protein